MSEWLIGCAFVLFVVVLVDGVRRMRAERRQEIKWDLQLSRDLPDDEEVYNDELLDRYRVVNRHGKPIAHHEGASAGHHQEPQVGQHDAPPEGQFDAELQGALEGQPQNGAATDWQDQRAEPYFGSADEPIANVDQQAGMRAGQHDWVETSTSASAASAADSHPSANTNSNASNNIDGGDFAREEMQLIVLHVKARQPQGFSGSDIVQVLVACNMRYGDNQILHRYVDTSRNSGPKEFSVANMVEPGTFDLDNLSGFRTPGITFFMALPGDLPDPVKAFNTMLETANCVVKNLDGVLLDEEHSTANQQVINHYRDRVRTLGYKHAEA